MYFVGILVILLGAFVVNSVTGYKARKSYFIMELPEYKKIHKGFLIMVHCLQISTKIGSG